MKTQLSLAALVAVIGFSCAACHKTAEETVETAGPMLVQTGPVALESIRATVTAVGTVAPSPGADWTIAAPENGRIVDMPKNEGDAFKQGDLLVRFEVPSLSAEIAARQAETAATNVRVQTARSNATRIAGLFSRGIAPQRDNDDARRELQEAETAYGQALGNKDATDALAAHLVVNARFDGVVARRWHNPGDQVEMGAADPVLRVIDPTRLEIVAAVPVSQLSLVGPGRPVRIFNPSDGSTTESAVITAPSIKDTMVATGDVRVALPKTTVLPAGTAVQIEILSEERTHAMVVPTSAVLREGADAYVMVAGGDGKAHRTPVVVGLIARERTQIMSGLTAGDRVILPGPEPVPDGAAIAIQK
jgi:membrane fusion protein, multidrug efflux system